MTRCGGATRALASPAQQPVKALKHARAHMVRARANQDGFSLGHCFQAIALVMVQNRLLRFMVFMVWNLEFCWFGPELSSSV